MILQLFFFQDVNFIKYKFIIENAKKHLIEIQVFGEIEVYLAKRKNI